MGTVKPTAPGDDLGRRRQFLARAGGAAATLALPLWARAQAAVPARPGPVEVRDVLGRVLPLPVPNERIAAGWHAHNAMLLMLGAGPRIIATVNTPAAKPWMYKVAPTLHQALLAPADGFRVEDLLLRRAQLVFLSPGSAVAPVLAKAGMTVVETTFRDFASLRTCVNNTAALLGGTAPERARGYLAHLDAVVDETTRITRPLPAQARPRVLHVIRMEPVFQVDGSQTMIHEWIEAAGGRNAAESIAGNGRTVTMEQVSAWDPDVIIVAANSAGHTPPAGYADLRAVRQKRVLVNPEGVFSWDRYGCEIALQVPWAASQLHPALFAKVDLVARTRDFYRRFFDYPLTEADARRIIVGLPPLA